MNEWGIPVSKDKIIARRNRLIEYQKVGELRFTPLYEIIDVNILDINYMLHEIDNLQTKIDKSDELIETYKNERDTYKRLAEEYINKYNDLLERTKEGK